MKLVSIDTETTGLDSKRCSVLEIGLVVYDTEKPFVQTADNSLRLILISDKLQGELYALNLNAGIMGEMLEAKKLIESSDFHNCYLEKKLDKMTVVYVDCEDPAYSQGVLAPDYIIESTIYKFLEDNDALHKEGHDREPKITVAGKNYAMFDHHFISNSPYLNFLTKIIRHRVYDVGTLYTEDYDKVIPNLSKCCKRAGLSNTTVTHYSVDDAVMVIKCIEAYFNTRRSLLPTKLMSPM